MDNIVGCALLVTSRAGRIRLILLDFLRHPFHEFSDAFFFAWLGCNDGENFDSHHEGVELVLIPDLIRSGRVSWDLPTPPLLMHQAPRIKSAAGS